MQLFKKRMFHVFSVREAFALLGLLIFIPFPHECLSLIYGQSNCTEHGMLCSCVVACNMTPRPLNKVSQLSDSGEACHRTTSQHVHETSSHHCSSELCSQNPQPQSKGDQVSIPLNNRAWLVSDVAVWTINWKVRAVVPALFAEEIAGYYMLPDEPPQLNFS